MAPPGKVLVDDFLPQELAQKAVGTATEKEKERIQIVAPPLAAKEDVQNFVSGICAGTLGSDDVQEKLQVMFGELDKSKGIYAQVEEFGEQQRVMCAMMSVYWLLGDHHNSFIEAQPAGKSMSTSLWGDWQAFVSYTDLSEETVHVLLVFLCIRGLSKSRLLAKEFYLSERASPADVLDELFERELITSCAHFNASMNGLLKSVIKINERFNLPQFLQGENLPCHIAALEECIKEEGEKPLKCYLFALVAMMCGLLATKTMKGSLFMDNSNGRTVLLGIQCLQKVGAVSPHAIYWSYVALRAEGLRCSTDTPEDLALARILCLNRATSADLDALYHAWDSLSKSERDILVEFFLADGIHKPAEVYVFLPLYFQNAKANDTVGLRLAFEVLVNLVELRQNEQLGKILGSSALEINLSDLAGFSSKVKCLQTFRLVSQHSLFVQQGDALHHLVSGDLWCQVNQVTRGQATNLKDVAYLLTKIERETAFIQSSLARIPNVSRSKGAVRRSSSNPAGQPRLSEVQG